MTLPNVTDVLNVWCQNRGKPLTRKHVRCEEVLNINQTARQIHLPPIQSQPSKTSMDVQRILNNRQIWESHLCVEFTSYPCRKKEKTSTEEPEPNVSLISLNLLCGFNHMITIAETRYWQQSGCRTLVFNTME